MKHPLKDINEMLDVLNLPLVSQRLNEIYRKPHKPDAGQRCLRLE